MEFSRIGVIGCGETAVCFADQWRHDPTLVLSAAADASQGALRRFAERFDLSRKGTYTDVEQMLRTERPPLVALCTWPNSHATYIRLCAVHGVRGVLCRSPLTTSAAEADRIRKFSSGAQMLVQEGFVWRHHPRFQRLRELVRTGVLGDVRALKVSVSYAVRDARDWRLREQVGGGVISDAGSSAVSAACALAGSTVRRVFCMLDGSCGAYGTLGFREGVVAQFEVSYVNNPLSAIEVIGTDARALLSPFIDQDDQPTTIDVERRGAHVSDSSEMDVAPGALQCLAAMRNLRDALSGRARLLFDLADSCRNARVVDACLKSARTGVVVCL